MFMALLGIFPAILWGIILFLINPILGGIWVLFLIGLAIYVLKFKKR